MVVEEQIVEGTLVEVFANEKTVVEGSVGEDMPNKKWKFIHFYIDYWELKPIASFIFKRFCFFILVVAII